MDMCQECLSCYRQGQERPDTESQQTFQSWHKMSNHFGRTELSILKSRFPISQVKIPNTHQMRREKDISQDGLRPLDRRLWLHIEHDLMRAANTIIKMRQPASFSSFIILRART